MDTLPDLPDESPPLEEWLTTTTGKFHFPEDWISTVFSALPIRQRQILELEYIGELSASEIAATLNCSVTHVYTQKYAAMKKLKAALMGGESDG